MKFLTFLTFLIILSACGTKEAREQKALERQQEQAQKAADEKAHKESIAQEKATAQSIGDCLKAEKAKPGVTKITQEMIDVCNPR